QAAAALEPGQVYDSNRYTIAALLRRLGCETLDLGVVRDDPAAIEAALRSAAAAADVVMTTGGVAEGDADHTRRMMARLGDVAFWKLAMRPGRPFAFGELAGGAFLFGLPGNPVAAMVGFYVFVRPALLAMMGCRRADPPLVPVRAQCSMPKRPGRTEYLCGVLEPGEDGW